MTRRLLLGYLSITAFVVVVLGVPLGVQFARSERNSLVARVHDDAEHIATFAVLPLAGARDQATLRQVAADYAKATSGRVVIVDRQGVSVADSESDPGRSFTTRPEIAAALRGTDSAGFRFSQTLGYRLLFVAQPVNSGAVILGAVRITYPAAVVDQRIRRSWVTIIVVGAGVLAAVTGVSVVFARSVTKPVRIVSAAAGRLGSGDLTARADTTHGPAELRGLASSFNETAANLEQLVHAQQAFVADASHQLRTPLAAMRLRLENLAAKSADTAQQRDVGAAVEEVQRLSRLVDGLLVLARTDSTPATPQALDVDDIVAGRLDAWAPIADTRDVRLVVEGRGGAALVTPDSLEQALDNLVANALDASPAGSVVTIQLERDAWVRVAVIDQGPGMTEAERSSAFTRFLSHRKPSGGFGLGLAIAKRLTTRDGGDITLDEAPGGGLAARLQLPLA
jgi:signal transduction histidine kinase